ncbi:MULTISPECIES: hypothetical protein [unclassified Pseudomonas]|uniref:hypothetical protein n=1 Tax=unclassified Pseudomonas TaxID=196821 RepID=UPI002446BC4D|nr:MULTISPECIES: hypothetical protein [unclassified Pseudomonas]MDG9930684.1 hypothetical protein [Pseudomonas sp. GD04042]MDH0485167.1 hypothetical protein [Pseudomonas sp. GD04015]MDH0606527.1 hypothetical protein [Pseudomonas sp. GD03869]
MSRVFYTLIWLGMSLLAGLLGSHLFQIDFWIASLIAGLALLANGLLADWEDRRNDHHL